jgi:2-dehydropantoate 2-reductase
MKIAVIGITPVGCTVACLLHDAGEDVTIIGPPEKVRRIAEVGMTVRQVWDGKAIHSVVKAATELTEKPGLLIFAARQQHTLVAATAVASHAGDATIATIQYGTKTEQIVAKVLPRDNIVTCMLTLGAACRDAGDVTLNFKGHMVIGKAYGAPGWRIEQVEGVMSKVFDTVLADKIAHYNCTRLLLNLPYCIPAILGEMVQKAFSDREISKVAVMLLKEGIKVIEDAEVHIEALPDFDERSLKSLLAAPMDEAALRFSVMMTTISKVPCQGPVLGSIEQGEQTEVDYINGEMVKIADVLGHPAPMNALMVELVHRVEKTKKFLSRDEFLEEIRGAGML